MLLLRPRLDMENLSFHMTDKLTQLVVDIITVMTSGAEVLDIEDSFDRLMDAGSLKVNAQVWTGIANIDAMTKTAESIKLPIFPMLISNPIRLYYKICFCNSISKPL